MGNKDSKHKKEKKRLDVLISGTKNSGKTTLFENFKFQFLNEKEISNNKSKLLNTIIINIIEETMLFIELFPRFEFSENEITKFKKITSSFSIEKKVHLENSERDKLVHFWNDKEVRKIYYDNYWKNPKLTIHDGFPQILENIEKYSFYQDNVDNFSTEDVLHANVRSSVVSYFTFNIFDDFELVLFLGTGITKWNQDWKGKFPDAKLILHVVNIASFRKDLVDHNKSLDHFLFDLEDFSNIANCEWFQNVPIFLVFTMIDVFEDCIDKFDFNDHFDDYNNFGNTKKFIIQKFMDCIVNRRVETVTVFETCGFDRERNIFLFELMTKKLKGTIIQDHYHFNFYDKKPLMNEKFMDLIFHFD
eukprot:gene10268-2687_t